MNERLRRLAVPVVASALLVWAGVASPALAKDKNKDCDIEGTEGNDAIVVVDLINVSPEQSADSPDAKVFGGLEIVFVKGALGICAGKGDDVVILDGLGSVSSSNETRVELEERVADEAQDHNLLLTDLAYDHDGVASVDLGKGHDVICAAQGSDEDIDGGKGSDAALTDGGDDTTKVEDVASPFDCIDALFDFLGVITGPSTTTSSSTTSTSTTTTTTA